MARLDLDFNAPLGPFEFRAPFLNRPQVARLLVPINEGPLPHGQVGDIDISAGIADGDVGVIEYKQVGGLPGMNLARDAAGEPLHLIERHLERPLGLEEKIERVVL